MKKLLKYLLFLVVTVAFWGSADKDVSSVSIEDIADMSIEDVSSHVDFSQTDYAFSLPRQTSFANSQRAQSSVRRTNSVHRSNTEFVKSGKVENAGLRFAIQAKSIIIHSSLIEPAHKLIYLGKLII
ncbi:MAG: hypothetical protein IKU36_04640 [Bacteroidales bacterium]|nr:hypothetical protein [Bacteroidales bacterium]